MNVRDGVLIIAAVLLWPEGLHPATPCDEPFRASAEACALLHDRDVTRVLGRAPDSAVGCSVPDSRAVSCQAVLGDARLQYRVVATPEFVRDLGNDWFKKVDSPLGRDLDWRTFGRMHCWSPSPESREKGDGPAPVGCILQRRKVTVSLRVVSGEQDTVSVLQARALLELACVRVVGCEAD